MPPLSYSVIIPAYNEEEWLPRTLTALKNAMDQSSLPGEVIVVDNNSTDRTAEIARKQGARVIFEPVNQIARARNAGGRAARGKFLLFLDADTLMSPAILKKAMANLAGGRCCGGGICLDFGKIRPASAQIMVDFWNWISLRFRLAAGACIYCLATAYRGTGGFDEKVYASEEIWFSLALQKWGKKRGMEFCMITEEYIASSSRKLNWFSPLQTRIMFLAAFLIPFAPYSKTLCRLWYKRPS
ncbi:MAG: glycosyltransferase [Desulfococcaceae bacterium]|jgi:glycosyltransferase involved in cell wall biosynthesis|nr:glycosyltransferase [Desulfococcaceae bacterium]